MVGDLGPFPAPLALNVVPWAGSLKEDGWSSEELKIRNESRKILGPAGPAGLRDLRAGPGGHHALGGGARHASRTRSPWPARTRYCGPRPGVVVLDDPAAGEFPTPADVVGTDPTWVGRIRRSLDDPKSLELFVCGDNLRKGAALNTAQIAELVAAELTGRS